MQSNRTPETFFKQQSTRGYEYQNQISKKSSSSSQESDQNNSQYDHHRERLYTF